MYGDWSEWTIELVGIVLTGIAIKFMDDYLDLEYDQCIGRKTAASKLGRAVLPYGLLMLAIGVFIAREVGLVLFLASYAIGMGHDLLEKMPTKLPGWAEGLIALAIGLVLAGPLLTLWGILIIATIQFLDDLMDIYKDMQTGQRNTAVRFGGVETTLLTLICLIFALLLSAEHSILVLVATPVVHMIHDIIGGD
ncbi:hypothetical protein [Effusibacillus dendaii]|uniref:Uncharacterized protein n=1 Tax=Effusibacillus dendaii TaxID=2743772 RepID=A0A7I8DCT6_9BACL|nr:hypothetical protein [Effusibacillus dendaii]BCJ85721.1 hypothetical protein skT53_07060 [Effusibacillus dendaii]